MELNTRHVAALWLAAAASLVGAAYAFMNSAYYAWVQAVGAQKGVRADVSSYGSLFASLGLLGLCGYLLFCIHRCYKKPAANTHTESHRK